MIQIIIGGLVFMFLMHRLNKEQEKENEGIERAQKLFEDLVKKATP